MSQTGQHIGERYGVPTCRLPDNPQAIYMRNLYHTFFWGPFENEQACAEAIAKLDKADQMWDYDPFCLIYGASPLPDDFVFGFKSLPDDVQKRLRERER